MTLRNDRWYPTYHIAAPAGWINDPNGLCFFRGRYHVFFQYHPYGTEWGPMHWGHMTSADLVSWEHQPIALAPSAGADSDGCWSGSCVVGDDGRLYAFYTGNHVRQNPAEGEPHRNQVQCLAISEDGIRFEKVGEVLRNPDCPTNFRDPKVWRQDGVWCMVVGQQSHEGRGQIALFTSPDLLTWSFAGIVYEHPDPEVFMLECPDLFPLGDRWVLCFSAMGLRARGYLARNLHNAVYLTGTWRPGEAFVPTSSFLPCDMGHNYYAPQSFEHEGRRIQFGWMSSFHTNAAEQQDGWCGQLTLPRELSLREDGRLMSPPAIKGAYLWGHHHTCDPFEVGANEERVIADDLACGCIELVLDLAHTTADRTGLEVHRTADGNRIYIAYDAQTGCVVVERYGTLRGHRGYRAAPVQGDELKLQVWLDRGSLEVFVNDGELAFSEMSYPGEGPRSAALVSEGSTTAVSSMRFFWS